MSATDFAPVVRVCGFLLCGLAALMLLPSAVDLAVANPDYRVFLWSTAITASIGGVLVAGTAGIQGFVMHLRQAFVLTVMAWLTVTAFGALPLVGLGLGYTDAFFETISGVTTTGSTVLVGLDGLPPGILIWRAVLQWMGGVGIIVMAIVILPFLRLGGMQLFRLESSDTAGRIVPRAVQLAGWITLVYVILTAACALAYGLTGMSPMDAICHAMTTLSTGGYSTHDESFAFFHNPATQWFGVLFMISGSVPFAVLIRELRGDHGAMWRDPQVRLLVVFLVIATAAMSLWLVATKHFGVLDSIRLSAFNITSVVTTTGYATADYSSWGAMPVNAFLIITFVGGCTGSTSGAIKIYRFHVLWTVVRGQLLRLASPRRIVTLRYGGQPLPPDVPGSVLAFIAVYLGSVALFTVVLGAMGLDLITAMSSAASALGNVGPGLGAIVGPTGNYASLPDAAKWILSAGMLLGRLEIFTVLVLLDPTFWRR